MKEILTIGIGQAGCNIGKEFWDLAEHKRVSSTDETDQSWLNYLYDETKEGKSTPRTVFIDSGIDGIGEISKSWQGTPLNDALTDTQLIAWNKHYFSGIYTEDYRTDSELIRNMQDALTTEVEKGSNLGAVQVITSLSGGTGSGVMYWMAHDLESYLGKKIDQINILNLPTSHKRSNVPEIYNFMCTFPHLGENNAVKLIFDNSAIFKLLEKNGFREIPNFQDINQYVAQMMMSIDNSYM